MICVPLHTPEIVTHSPACFQLVPGDCRFCQDCSGDDSLEHYVQCHYLWDCLPHWSNIRSDSRSLVRSLLIKPLLHESVDKLAVLIFAAYGAFNKARAIDTRFTPRESELVVLERFSFAWQQSQYVDKLFS